jgi:hypothetical protein
MQLMKEDRAVVIQFRGEVAACNPFGMRGAVLLGDALADGFDVKPISVGEPRSPSSNRGWARSGQSELKLLGDISSMRLLLSWKRFSQPKFPLLHEHV